MCLQVLQEPSLIPLSSPLITESQDPRENFCRELKLKTAGRATSPSKKEKAVREDTVTGRTL